MGRRLSNRQNGQAAKRQMQRAVAEAMEGRVLLAGVSFVGVAEYATGKCPWSVASGDFNGDGKADLVVANAEWPDADTDIPGHAYKVSVLLNNGDGTLADKVDYEVGRKPWCVTTGDINGDGKTDLVAAGGEGVSILFGNGKGQFGVRVEYATGHEPRSVTCADFNGDGKLDLAVANTDYGGDGRTVSVLLNKGNGTFGKKADYIAGWHPYSMTSADFNGDGRADLAVANTDDATVSVLMNNGDGTFADRVDYAGSRGPIAVATADFNGDGKADLAVADYADNIVSVLMNRGDGTFGAKVDYGTGGQPRSVVAADLNGDGKADLAVADVGNQTVSVLRNKGNGRFARRVDYGTSGGPWAVTAADVNGDRMLDLVAATGEGKGSALNVLVNKGDGTFVARTDYSAGRQGVTLATGDVDGDGWVDMVVACPGADPSAEEGVPGGVRVLLNKGDGVFGEGIEYVTGGRAESVALADLNGDGWLDLAVAEYGFYPDRAGSVSVLMNKGDGTFAEAVDHATGTCSRSVTSADFNGDGKLDLAVANGGTQGVYPGPYYVDSSVSVLLNQGDGTFAGKVDYATGANPRAVTSGDFNGDGKPDLAVANEDGHSLSVLLNQGDGTFSERVDYSVAWGDWVYSVVCADLNGDGKLDLAAAGGDIAAYVFLGNGDGTFAPTVSYDAGVMADGYTSDVSMSITAADLDCDGTMDLAVANYNTGTAGVLLNKGDGTFGTVSKFAGGGMFIASADFNGDGKADLAALANDISTSNGPVSVLLNSTAVPTTPLVVNSTGATYMKLVDGYISVWNNADGLGAPAMRQALAMTSMITVEGAAGGGSISLDFRNGSVLPKSGLVVDTNGGLQMLNEIGSRRFALSVTGSGVVALGTVEDQALILSRISIAPSGSLDTSAYKLVVRAPRASTREAVLATVSKWIMSARDGGTWEKSGITSSIARGDESGVTGLGVVLNDQGEVVVRYTWNGDANLDGLVNADDYFLADSGLISHKAGWSNGDFNYDGVIGAGDYYLMDVAMMKQSGTSEEEVQATGMFQASRVIERRGVFGELEEEVVLLG